MECLGTCLSCSHRYCAKKVRLFESLTDLELERVLGLIERLHFDKGESIFLEGDVFDRLYIVNGGSFKVYRLTKEGKEQILYILGDGDFIGDLNLFKKDVFGFSAIALEETHLCTIKKDAFDGLLRAYPELYDKMLSYAHDRIVGLEALVQTLTAKDVDTRLASLLLKLADSFGIQKPHGIEIQLNLTREEMASFIGLTRETVSRRLSNLQAEGLIELIDNHQLLIKDIEALQDLSEL